MPLEGLTKLTTRDLENLLRALYRDELSGVVSKQSLGQAGLSYLWDRCDFLNGLEADTVRHIVVAVIAERRARR